MIRCIAFDFDGTLVLSNEIKHQSFFDVTNHLLGAKQLLKVVLADPDFGDRYTIFRYLSERLTTKVDGCEVDAAQLAEKYTILCEQKIIQAPEVAGAFHMLTELSKTGFKMAVSSATPEKTLKKIVSQRGLNSMFEKILGAPASKAQHLEEISRAWKYKPTETVYIGDSEVDRKAALTTGCHFIGIGKDSSRFNEKPPILIDSLSHLPVLVGMLAKN